MTETRIAVSNGVGKMSDELTQSLIDLMNVPQNRTENRAYLDSLKDESGLSGVDLLTHMFGLNPITGLTANQVLEHRAKFGTNEMPASPKTSYFTLLLRALSDTTLLVLIAAACVSFGIGYWEDPKIGWIEGTAIFIAVFLVSNISAGNDYTKELQFRALESSSQQDQRTSVLRDGQVELINPADLVAGDICVLQTGDMITADCVIVDNNEVSSNESGLTGEPKDMRKSKTGDCFLLSSCLLTEGEGCRAVVIGIGMSSQWGKIKSNLVTESVNTPLQEKLERMTTLIGYIGIVAAVATFAALVIRIFTDHGASPDKKELSEGFIGAFILAVTIVVVAIPEGLPLAVTISLAYSTKKMYDDKCSIRSLAACETMGNATTICSDKTGTLTENRMTVVEGWFGNKEVATPEILNATDTWISKSLRRSIIENCSINRTAYLVMINEKGEKLDSPVVVGNKTEGALINLIRAWGEDYESVKATVYNEATDKVFPFDSTKKRSTAVVFNADGTVRLYCKGATEVLLSDCDRYTGSNGEALPMTPAMLRFLDMKINFMAKRALRTLMLAHADFASAKDLPLDWMTNPPDDKNLICDSIVGIIDPLRKDVKDAVLTAQRAGVVVRMVTGDNIHTASAIAAECGILTRGGLALEGPVMRNMTCKELDEVLPRLQVLARSSPEDKFLLVCRLNGFALPKNKEEWEEKHKKRILLGATWENDRDKILPGYYEEWSAARPEGGQVVGVTGDGTNDAPALKAADVGMAMGISGTKVAQQAADVVILDDKFGSIVNAIMWGRAVYDNIRKFLQFQLTVNVVALLLVFIGAVAGFGQPLNAVMMLWVNLIMDTMGALALGTEAPTKAALLRKPYKRTASLISRPMRRNILCQSAFQLTLLFVLLFKGASMFGVKPIGEEHCLTYYVNKDSQMWDSSSRQKLSTGTVGCTTFKDYCPDKGEECFRSVQRDLTTNNEFVFADLEGFASTCLDCRVKDYVHGTIIFNAFIFCQIFNEYTARKILNEWNMFAGVFTNFNFILVSAVTIGLQVFLVEIGGDFVRTSPLTLSQWFITMALGAIGIPVGMLMRLIPVTEDPKTFFSEDPVTCTLDRDSDDIELAMEPTLDSKLKYMILKGEEMRIPPSES